MSDLPIPVAERSKTKVCDRSLAGISGSNPSGTCLSFVSVCVCQVEISASGRSPDWRNSTDYVSVIVCDLETSEMRRP